MNFYCELFIILRHFFLAPLLHKLVPLAIRVSGSDAHSDAKLENSRSHIFSDIWWWSYYITSNPSIFCYTFLIWISKFFNNYNYFFFSLNFFEIYEYFLIFSSTYCYIIFKSYYLFKFWLTSLTSLNGHFNNFII